MYTNLYDSIIERIIFGKTHKNLPGPIKGKDYV